jgi:hypothetical protein
MAVQAPEILLSQGTERQRGQVTQKRNAHSLVRPLNEKLVPGKHKPPCRFSLVNVCPIERYEGHGSAVSFFYVRWNGASTL